MRKKFWLVCILFMILLLSSCSNNGGLEEREVASTIDTELVTKITGDWLGDTTANYPAQGKFTIVEKGGYVFFDGNKLHVIDTINNEIHTQTDGEKPFYYDFKLNDNKLTVYPSYSVPEGMAGGSLAPMDLVRDDEKTTDISTLYGEWVSVEESETYYMSIEKVSDNSIRYADNLENTDSQILEIEEVSRESVTALTEDEASCYSFILSDESDKITVFMGVNPSYYEGKGEESPTGLSKPIVYKKVVK
ncbi:hypothetical protein ACYSNU_13880 [Enterococcus sp. LJL120]